MRSPIAARLLAAALVVAWLALPAPARAEDWQSIEAAAKREGKITLYNGTALNMIRVIAQRFQQHYAIPVELLEGRASEIYEWVRTEQAAGQRIGDLLYNGANTMAASKSIGMVVPHGELPNAQALLPGFADDGTATPVSSSFFAILVSDSMASAADEPKHWQDLLDPKWKGKILSDDFRAAGAGEVFFNVMLDKYGRAFHERLAAQEPQFSRFFAESERRVARGEFALYIPLNLSEYPGLKGLPVRMVVPDEGVPYVTLSLGILKNAPHPNAARLFINYAISKEAQLASGSTGAGITIKGLSGELAEEARRLAEPKLLGGSDPARFQEMLKLAAEIYK